MKNTCEIEQTIKTLEQAIANKKVEMQNARAQSHQSGVSLIPHLVSEVLQKSQGPYVQMTKALEHGGEFARDFLNKTQQSIQEKPWDALRKVAVYSFGIGLFFALRRHRTSSTREKE